MWDIGTGGREDAADPEFPWRRGRARGSPRRTWYRPSTVGR
ncbi:MAG: hypothetical protein AVDCRST_MAG19-957 [uncultured Thermomicrobiales bacterium]|uniref:Uncharacterized protein n=1 Tax=uncultured Thermomicrobiales bacterium TaxID=1645740 RepID=A0A6J4UJJ5_9BACT|nr:MAG: hypothetical protein AVDCRST_MAG19-957 [uncultured Thermomicrobiales bacterium]